MKSRKTASTNVNTHSWKYSDIASSWSKVNYSHMPKEGRIKEDNKEEPEINTNY
jgi:hypothetical protein